MIEKINHRKKYFFDDFTQSAYRNLLQLAKEYYTFATYDSFDKANRFVLWRHDIDFSLNRSLELARIEQEEGVKATYFILPHSEYYNVLEKESKKIVEGIIGMGHSIGLHFDTHFYDITNEAQIASALYNEKSFFENIFNVPINVFSFHNTTPFTMNSKNWEYGGLINTYAEYFQTQVKYCSDSNGFWQYDRLHDLLKAAKHQCLQILTHPEWWTEGVMSPKEKIYQCIEDRKQNSWNNYVALLQANNRLIIDWEDGH